MVFSIASNARSRHTGGLAAAFVLASAPVAAASAPLWDAGRCGALAIASGAEVGPPGNRHAADWRATLAAPGSQDTAGRLHAHALASEGPASLDGLPALVAGATLIVLDPDRPHACDLQHAFREVAISLGTLPPGGSAGERWTGIEAHSHGNDLSVGALRLHVTSGPRGQTAVEADARAISTAGTDMTATPIAAATIRLSAPSDRVAAIARGDALRDDDTIHIELVRFSGGDALVEATGIVHPANRSGHLDVRARDMEGLRDALPADERSRAGAAFLVLRLAANKDPDGRLHWDVAWEDRLVTVNGVPLPVRY